MHVPCTKSSLIVNWNTSSFFFLYPSFNDIGYNVHSGIPTSHRRIIKAVLYQTRQKKLRLYNTKGWRKGGKYKSQQQPATNGVNIYRHTKGVTSLNKTSRKYNSVVKGLKELQLEEDTRSGWREFQSGITLSVKEDLWALVLYLG